MTSQDRRYQDNRYQQDDNSRRERWRDERDDDNRRYQGSERDFREAWSGYGRGREIYPQREGRWQDESRQNEFPGNRSGGFVNRGRFEEGYFGDRGDQWDAGRERYLGGDRLRESEIYRSFGPFAWGRRGGEHDDQNWEAPRDYFGRQQRSSWDRLRNENPSWAAEQEAADRFREDQGQDQGQYQGRDERARYHEIGPKNYKRSDDRIREDVSDRLTDDPYVNAAEIEVSAANSEVTLNGSIDNREQRRIAELIAEHVSGVSHVQNNLRVKSQQQGQGQGPGQGASSQSPSGAGKAGSHA